MSRAFVRAIDSKSQNYTLVHVVFDRYDIDKSLKPRTRNRRQGKEGTCCKYDVTDMTQFNMPLNHFLSNSENKDQLNLPGEEGPSNVLLQANHILILVPPF